MRVSRTERETGAEFPRTPIRALQLVEYVARNANGVSLTQASKALRIPKTSAFQLLRALTHHGYVVSADGRYRLGLIARQLALFADRNPSSLGIRAVLEALSADIEESVSFCMMDPVGMMVDHVEVVQSKHVIRYVIEPGTKRPLYCSSPGQVLLAWQDPGFIADYVRDTALTRLTANTIVTPSALQERLARIRQDGYNVVDSEMTPGVIGAAVPILSPEGNILAALAMGAPHERGTGLTRDYVAHLRRAARRLSGQAIAGT